MAFRWLMIAVTGMAALAAAMPARAYLFWTQPKFAGSPVSGDEPGLGLPMPNASPAELKAHVLWNLRAGLNVAALQCQFSPILMAVANYNELVRKHRGELLAAQDLLSNYFKRQNARSWQKDLDSYTTKTYNGFSTMNAQLGFCETASQIGRDVRKIGRGQLTQLALERIRELRNSLIPASDSLSSNRATFIPVPAVPSMDKKCWTKQNLLVASCAVASTMGGRDAGN